MTAKSVTNTIICWMPAILVDVIDGRMMNETDGCALGADFFFLIYSSGGREKM
jgi:hypothetical protein